MLDYERDRRCVEGGGLRCLKRGHGLLHDPMDAGRSANGEHLLRERQEPRAGAGGGDDGFHGPRLSLSALPPILAAASRFHPLIP